MKKSRFSEQQIAFILKQADDGTSVEEVCRKAGISQQTYYRWRKKYAGLMPSELKRLKQLEEENGPRDVPGGVTACYASRTVDFKKAGTATIEQTCTDEEQRQFTDSGDATWSIKDDTLCLDTRPLDRDPGCWEITYRDGTFEFKNEAKTIRWFGRVFSSDTESLEQLVNGMTQN